MQPLNRVVVTGAAGLLGGYVLSACRARGWEVMGLDLRPEAQRSIVACDLMDAGRTLACLRGADAVLHVAALPRPTGFTADEVFSTNIRSLFTVLAALESLAIRRLVYASSFSVLGLPFAPTSPVLDFLPVSEDHPSRPQDMYALSKWLGEEMIDAWVRRTGSAATSLRMPWVQTSATFEREVVPRRTTADAELDLWAYIDARDAANAFVAALDSDRPGHDRAFISAADTYARSATDTLVRASRWVEVPRRSALNGHASLIGTEHATRTLGWRPRHSWREYDNT